MNNTVDLSSLDDGESFTSRWSPVNIVSFLGFPLLLLFIVYVYSRSRGNSSTSMHHRSESEKLAVERADPCVLRLEVLGILMPKAKVGQKVLVYDIKTKRYVYSQSEEKMEPCGICLHRIESGEQALVSKCQHSYHKDCILGWIKQPETSGMCPCCRQQMWDSAEYSAIETAMASQLWEQRNQGEYERQFYLDVEYERRKRQQRSAHGGADLEADSESLSETGSESSKSAANEADTANQSSREAMTLIVKAGSDDGVEIEVLDPNAVDDDMEEDIEIVLVP